MLLAGSISASENSFGVGIGGGIGAAAELIWTETTVFATTLDDLEYFEDSFYEMNYIAQKNNGIVSVALRNISDTERSGVEIALTVISMDDNGQPKILLEKSVMKVWKHDERDAVYTDGVTLPEKE